MMRLLHLKRAEFISVPLKRSCHVMPMSPGYLPAVGLDTLNALKRIRHFHSHVSSSSSVEVISKLTNGKRPEVHHALELESPVNLNSSPISPLRSSIVPTHIKDMVRHIKGPDSLAMESHIVSTQDKVVSDSEEEFRAAVISDDISNDVEVTTAQNEISNSALKKKELSSIYQVLVSQGVERDQYWTRIPQWRDISEEQFLSYQWQTQNNIQTQGKLLKFLESVLPATIPHQGSEMNTSLSRKDFLLEVIKGMKVAPMSIRLTPHILSVIDWNNPIQDPVRQQFIPFNLSFLPDHPRLTLDSLGEEHDSPVPGLVHRYPDKALFLAGSACPVYCRYCTRSYAVGGNTDSVIKNSVKPTLKRWNQVFEYIENAPALHDIVVSGGDCFLLQPQQIYDIGKRLLEIPHIRRFRFATKGLAVCPSRFLDPDDQWTEALTAISNKGKEIGKEVSIHTHFNHPNEMTWIAKAAALKLFRANVRVRNQSVLLRGVNDDLATMVKLIRSLADNNINPYYVYQGDMVKGVEDLRTPLQTILDLECQIRGSIAGFTVPSFVVDLPGGGGKRLAASYQTYDKQSGKSTFIAPAVHGEGKENKVYEYHDPVWSLS